jgi:cytochrome c553
MNRAGAIATGLLVLAAQPGLISAGTATSPSKTSARSPGAADTSVCAACHGAHGEGSAAAQVPRIAGQSAEYLQKQLDDYASGARDNAIMANFAKSLSFEQRGQLAERYAAMSAPLLPEPAANPKQLVPWAGWVRGAARGPLSRRAVVGIHQQRTPGVSRWITKK